MFFVFPICLSRERPLRISFAYTQGNHAKSVTQWHYIRCSMIDQYFRSEDPDLTCDFLRVGNSLLFFPAKEPALWARFVESKKTSIQASSEKHKIFLKSRRSNIGHRSFESFFFPRVWSGKKTRGIIAAQSISCRTLIQEKKALLYHFTPKETNGKRGENLFTPPRRKRVGNFPTDFPPRSRPDTWLHGRTGTVLCGIFSFSDRKENKAKVQEACEKDPFLR